jgi:hypothetical protein
MPGPIRQSSLVNQSGVQDSTVTAASVNGVAAANMLVAVVVAYCNTSTQSGDIVNGYTSTPSNTWTLAERVAQTTGVWRTEITVWVAPNVASGNTTGKPTFTSGTTAAHWCWHHLDEWAGMATSSPIDKTSEDTEPENSGTITVPNTATLAQAEQVVYAVAACRWNYAWNGSYSAPGTAPSTYTVLQGTTDNATLMVAQSSYKEVLSTNPVGATWTYEGAPGDNGAVALVVTFKKSSTSLRLEIDNIDSADMTGTTGWTLGAWPADPFQTGPTGQCAKVWTSYSATITSGKLILPDAPPGAAVNDTYNVSGHQPAGTRNLAWCSGVVRVVV